MIYFTGLVVTLLVLTCEASIQAPYCPQAECLKYDLICKTEEYEVRRYLPVNVILTLRTTKTTEEAMDAFTKLEHYINGENDKGITLDFVPPMSVVSLWKIPGDKGQYLIVFILPAEYQQDPPVPTDPDLHLEAVDGASYYVMTYKGWTSEEDHLSKVKKLTDVLTAAGASYNDEYFFSHFYSSSKDIFIDIGIPVVGDPVCGVE